MPIVAFLRGVNVGGYRRFRPTALAQELKDYGIVNIGAAGTFVFSNRISQNRLRSEIMRRLPFEAEVMMCSGRQLIAATSHAPFDDKPPAPDIVRFVSVLKKRPRVSPAPPILVPENGRWLLQILEIREQFVFGFYRREMKAISCLGSIDKLFGVPATTRNWTTITAILDVLKKL
ncbi:MAG TPA: DUF1697 domain-containing protein [Terriglobales bacterium]|nr:DUF1697 domain-containing protein [Terriglobales bacterium]